LAWDFLFDWDPVSLAAYALKGIFTNFKSHVLSIFDDANDAFSTMSPQSSTLSSDTVYVNNSGYSIDQDQVFSI